MASMLKRVLNNSQNTLMRQLLLMFSQPKRKHAVRVKYKYRFLEEFGSMSTRIRNRPSKVHTDQPEDIDSDKMSFDVVEWLEGERLEHERRMQELGYSSESKEELAKPSDKQHRKRTRSKI